MKICHLITRMIIGGAQENTLFTCRGLVEKGHEVVLVTGSTSGPEGNLLEQISIPGLRIIEVPHLVRELSLRSDLLAFFALRKFFLQEQFDVVHTHSSKAGFLGRLAAVSAGVPLVFHTIHGQAFHPYQAAWKNCLFITAEKIAARGSTKIFAVAQAMIDQALRANIGRKEQYLVNYSGMDIATFMFAQRDTELREKLAIPPQALVVGTVARLFELKGYEYLIEAAPEIVQAIPQIHFLIVGDGIYRERYEQMIAKQGLTDHFTFAGLVPPEQIPSYLAQMDILVHLSLREGLPRAVVQALANRKPVVAFPLDGTPEVVLPEKTGLLCKTGDVPEVAQAIIRLATHPEMRQEMGTAGQKWVQHRFDWHYMVDQIEKVYQQELATLKDKNR